MIIKRMRNGQNSSEEKRIAPPVTKKQITKETSDSPAPKYVVKKKKGGCGCGKKKG